ncbi:Ig-like domain-containing protein [Metabacillus fastidiosus]|uniref:Ig-like domain-containing protein n=1 Tax=Metabacillus fastidiosus TaxID=1458 RepID=UPI002DB9302D|nr:Ig-like domain-containing protein [Metabacillus fastidiosus]MEC2077849.1 Ig-like domain-containing protein [Metabacillus fastidiosus]
MSKKKIAKFGLTAAVAATTVVAATPADAASVSATEKAVQQASQSANALVKYYSSTDLKVTGEFTTAFNNAKKAIANAKAAVAQYKGKEKAYYEATIAKAESHQLYAARYIDAVGILSGKLVDSTKEVSAYIKSQKLNADTVAAYDRLSAEIKKAEAVIGKVRGGQVREAFKDSFLLDAKLTREALIYEVSQYQLLNQINEKLKGEEVTAKEIEADFAKLDRLKERAVAIKEAGRELYPDRDDVYPEHTAIEQQLRNTEKAVRKAAEDRFAPVVESIQEVADITVDEGKTVALPEKVEVKLSNGEKAEKAVTWENKDLTKVGEYTLKGKVADTDLEATVKVTVKAVDPKVESVSAINATQIVVTFNKELDKTTAEAETNYKFNNQALNSYDGSATAVLQDGKKSVLVTFSASKNKTSFTFGVDGVKTTDKKDVTVFSGTVNVDDKAAPTVSKSEFLSNGNIEVTLSEPLATTTPIVRVDGKPVTASVSGSKVVVTAAALSSAGVTVNGGETVSIYVANVTDTVGNELDLYNGTVTKANDTTAPAITSVTQVGHNQLKVVFSEALGAAASDLGTNEFKFLKGSTVYNSTNVALDADDTTNKTYIVTFTATDIYGSTNPVDSQAVTLILDKDAVKDGYSNGNAAYSQSFTFNSDKTGPSFVSAEVSSNKQTFELKFDEAFTGGTANVDESKIIVTDANGVRYSVQDATTDVKAGAGNEKILVVDFIPASAVSQVIANGNYTVTVQAGAIKDARSNNNIAAATTLTVGDSADTQKPAVSLDGASGENKFVVNFGEEVTSSALQLSNYKLDGKALPAGTVIYFNSTAKNSVTIELPNGSKNIGEVGTGTSAVLNVANVADKAGNVADTKNLNVVVSDNTSATLQTVQVIGNDIILTFNEAINATTAAAINDPTKLAADFEIKVNGNVLNLGTTGTGVAGDGSAAAVTTSLVSGNNKQVKISLTSAVAHSNSNDAVASNWDNTKPVTVKVKGSTLKDANLFLLTEGTAVSK